MNTRAALLFACVTLLAAASAAAAQRWGRGRVPPAGACFYRDTNFRGDYFCVDAGESIGSMPEGMNDRISSIRIVGQADVTVFKDVRFDGGSYQFDWDVPNLKDEGWNDRISSIRVQRPRRSAGNPRPGGGRPGRASVDAERIVRRAYQDVLEREPDQAGMRTYRSHIVDDGWTESEVRAHLRKSDEYREKNPMTYAKAQEIVRRAYLAVFNREPDPNSRGWVDAVMREKLSQADLERELRRSPEYRNRQ